MLGYAKLSDCWLQLPIYNTDVRVLSIFSRQRSVFPKTSKTIPVRENWLHHEHQHQRDAAWEDQLQCSAHNKKEKKKIFNTFINAIQCL